MFLTNECSPAAKPHHISPGKTEKYFVKQSISRFTCPEITVSFSDSFQVALFFFADSRRKKGFQLVKSFHFCLGQQKKKEPLEKNH